MPGHQFVNALLGPAVHQARQQFGDVELRIDAVELASLCRSAGYAEWFWMEAIVGAHLRLIEWTFLQFGSA
jgi:hypothetical protein